MSEITQNFETIGNSANAAAAHAEAAVRRLYEAMNSRAAATVDAVIAEVLAPDWENIPAAPGTAPGAGSLRGTVAFLGGVLPDFTITHQDIVATGGKVAVRSVSRGTHTGGEMLGFAPTGRVLEYRAFDFHHVQGGRIVRSWHLEDLFAVLQQLQASGNAS